MTFRMKLYMPAVIANILEGRSEIILDNQYGKARSITLFETLLSWYVVVQCR